MIEDPFRKMQDGREVLLEKLRNTMYLPTRAEVLEASKSPGSLHEYLNDLVMNDGPYSKEYEILTREFVGALSSHLIQKIEDIYKVKGNEVVLLEVGAGKGRLSHFLGEDLKNKVNGKYKIYVTDSGKWDISTPFPVEQLDAREAVEKYNPDLVYISFMPNMGTNDWTEDIAKTSSVKEYIVIGPYQPEPHGDFNSKHLEEVEKTQICLHDEDLSLGKQSESKTISHVRGSMPKITIIKK